MMVPVITDEPVTHWCLRRSGLDGRVTVNDSIGGVVTRIGDAINPDTSVVTSHVGEEPFDRVIGVCVLVDVTGARLDREIGPDIDKLPLRHVAATHILKDKDETVPGKTLVGTEYFGIGIRAIGRSAVKGSSHQEGPGSGGVLGDVHRCEKANSVPHGDQVLKLVVVFPCVVLVLSEGCSALARSDQNQEANDLVFHGTDSYSPTKWPAILRAWGASRCSYR